MNPSETTYEQRPASPESPTKQLKKDFKYFVQSTDARKMSEKGDKRKAVKEFNKQRRNGVYGF